MTNIRELPQVEISVSTRTDEDWLDALTYVDSSNNPVALSGISFTGAMRIIPGQGAYVLQPTTANGQLVIGGAGSNVLSFLVPAAVMGSVAPVSYAIDIVATADGYTINVVTGAVTVLEGV
jgi:hypothetical protein